jgi:hypothetical protein
MPGIATGVAFDNYLPQNAFIENVLVEIVTVFNAGTTNVLTVGTVGATYNNIVAAGDVNEAAAGVYQATRGARPLADGGGRCAAVCAIYADRHRGDHRPGHHRHVLRGRLVDLTKLTGPAGPGEPSDSQRERRT